MIVDLKPYPEYKDSGVPWAEKVPAHWKVTRGKSLFAESSLPVDEQDEIVTCFRDGQVTLRRNRRTSGFMIALKEHGYQHVKRGQLVIHAMDAFAGAIGVSDSNGKCTPEYIVCDPRDPETVPGYFAQALRLAAHSNFIQISCSAVRERAPRLRYPNFGEMQIPNPPPSEQLAIVRFLDHADRLIKQYIRAKQKLIKLLEEQKQAIIHRAVTRGLDPNVKLKPSGVEWLGEVPEGWKVVAFSRCAQERADYRGATPTKTESGIFLVTAKNIRKGWIDYGLSQEFVSPVDYPTIMRRGLPRFGDLLFTTEAPLGHAALVDREDVAFAQRVIRFRMNSNMFEPNFVLYSVLSQYFQNQLLRRATGSTASGIKASKLPQLRILAPSLSEQRQILQFIASECDPLAIALEKATRELSLLREYRTRLIADVVTGKLDVRDAAASLPELLDEPAHAVEVDEVADEELDAAESGDVEEADA